jgi:2'-5' RNA ligase
MENTYIKTFEEFILENGIILNENSKKVHDYGCVMLYLKVDNKDWNALQDLINEEDIYKANEYGREDEVHVTILYGLHEENKDEDIKVALENIEFSKPFIELNTLSLFTNDDFDVIKFDVESEDLLKMNKILSKFPHTTDYPDYHAHCTVAYVKSGTGKKYLKKFKETLNVKPDIIVYSKVDGSKCKWPFKKSENE